MKKLVSTGVLGLFLLTSCTAQARSPQDGPTPTLRGPTCVHRVLTKPFVVDERLRYDPPGDLRAPFDWQRACVLAVPPGSNAATGMIRQGFTTETVTFAIVTAQHGFLQHRPVYWIVLSGKNACVTSVNSLRCLPNQHTVGSDYSASPGPDQGKWIDGYVRPGLEPYATPGSS